MRTRIEIGRSYFTKYGLVRVVDYIKAHTRFKGQQTIVVIEEGKLRKELFISTFRREYLEEEKILGEA